VELESNGLYLDNLVKLKAPPKVRSFH